MNESANGKTNALAGLLNKLDLPTLLMVLFMGGGNILATKEDGKLTREEAERVTREVHEMHAALDRNKDEFKQVVEDTAQIRRIVEDIQRRLPK